MYMVRFSRTLALLLASAVLSMGLAAEKHIVPLAELRQDTVARDQKRAADLVEVGKLLDLAPVQKVLKRGNLDAGQVRQAAALLDESELSRLAARASQVRSDIEGGALTNQQLTYIVIALATAVIILVIVAA